MEETQDVIKVKRLGIPKIMSFLVQCEHNKERHVILQGGRRSGKTTSLCLYFILHALQDQLYKRTLVCTMTHRQGSGGSWIDFMSLIKRFNIEHLCEINLSSRIITINECTIEFVAFDDPQKAKGYSCDAIWFNEANRFKYDTYLGVSPNARIALFYDFNPNEHFWVEDFINQNNYLKTTWQDNPYLTASQIQEFEMLKNRGEFAKPGSLDHYFYQVYYLGNFSARGGTVFQYETCTLDEYKALAVAEFAGLDFGAVKDPNALVGCKVFEGKIYLHEYIYKTAMSTYELYQKLCTLPKFQSIVYDYAGLAQTLVQDIVNYGYKNVPIHQATKTRVEEGVVNLASLPLILVDTDENLNREFSSYVWDTEKLEYSGDDHLIDATRYITHKLTLHKVIQY